MKCAAFSPDTKCGLVPSLILVQKSELLMIRYIAVTHDSHVQVWKTPNHLVREFAPFELHRTYTGHHDEVTAIQWSSDSKCVVCFLDLPLVRSSLIAMHADTS